MEYGHQIQLTKMLVTLNRSPQKRQSVRRAISTSLWGFSPLFSLTECTQVLTISQFLGFSVFLFVYMLSAYRPSSVYKCSGALDPRGCAGEKEVTF